MSESSPSRSYVTLAVSFHIGTALAVTIINKAVLNTLPVPVMLLLSQSFLSIVFIHLGSMLKLCSIPKLSWTVVRSLLPLLVMRIVAHLSKIFCLLNVNASFYQIARGLLLPFTILLSVAFLQNSRPSSLALIGCVITTVGFLSGVSGEAVGQTSTAGIVWGVWSSLTTAVETVLVKHFVSGPKVGILELVYTTSMATIPVYALIIVSNGEFLQMSSLGLAHPVMRKFEREALIAGVFNFLLSMAAYLQIRATSPTTHMISTAARGVLQSLLAVVLIRNERLTRSRVTSIVMIISGSMVYAFAKENEKRSKATRTILPLKADDRAVPCNSAKDEQHSRDGIN